MKTKKNNTTKLLAKTYGINRHITDQEANEVPVRALIKSTSLYGESPCEAVPEWVFFKAQELKSKVNSDTDIRKWCKTEATKIRKDLKAAFGTSEIVRNFTYCIPTAGEDCIEIDVI